MIIGCSGRMSEHSGIGVVQKHLYAYLAAAGHELVLNASRDVGGSPLSRVRGLARGFRRAPDPVDVFLSAVPPIPLGKPVPQLTIIHDLRWLRTRSAMGARYRAWDLGRTVRSSDVLLCISDNTRRELLGFHPEADSKAVVQWLGSGLVPDASFTDSRSGLLMLVGAAPHKRNEKAAAALAMARPAWLEGVIGVGVSDEVRRTLSGIFPCEWFSAVSEPEMIRLYQRAQYFMMLGTDEGFGLPFVEALAAGCQVIAVDHPLAREVLGQAGIFLASGNSAQISLQLKAPPAIEPEIRRVQAANYSWSAFGGACEKELLRIAEGY